MIITRVIFVVNNTCYLCEYFKFLVANINESQVIKNLVIYVYKAIIMYNVDCTSNLPLKIFSLRPDVKVIKAEAQGAQSFLKMDFWIDIVRRLSYTCRRGHQRCRWHRWRLCTDAHGREGRHGGGAAAAIRRDSLAGRRS
jgi:hypothetical protein